MSFAAMPLAWCRSLSTSIIPEVRPIRLLLATAGFSAETATASTVVAIEEKGGILQLIAPSPRGGPGHTLPKARRSMRMLGVPHFEINDAVMAEEVQGVRPFGERRASQSVMNQGR